MRAIMIASIKPLTDASTWDEDRINRCCSHVIRPDARSISFCRLMQECEFR